MPEARLAEDWGERLIHAFPPTRFEGKITADCYCDECTTLRQQLPGKSWDEIPSSFLDLYSGSLPLLTPAALVAFLPAWLNRAMETLESESVLAELTLYFLCPGDEEDGWQEATAGERIALFNDTQRLVAVEFLQSVKANTQLKSWHERASKGLSWWESHERRSGTPPEIPPDGRVLSYVNNHGHHHRHFMGEVTSIEFSGYESIADRFCGEVRELWRREDEENG